MKKTLIVDEVDYDIRYSSTNDESVLRGWLEDENVRLWFPPTSDSETEIFCRNWIGFSRYKSSLTAEYKGEPVGIATIFLMPYVKVAHLCMMYMVVNPKFQKRGVGTSLLRNIKHLAKTRFRLESMHLEVFEGCPLIPILEKQGFEVVVTQGKFVKFPEGFASRMIMETKL